MMIEFLNFDDIVWIALMQTRQMVAGCPVDCHDTPWNCDRDDDAMPVHCQEDLHEHLLNDKLMAKYTDECGRPVP